MLTHQLLAQRRRAHQAVQQMLKLWQSIKMTGMLQATLRNPAVAATTNVTLTAIVTHMIAASAPSAFVSKAALTCKGEDTVHLAFGRFDTNMGALCRLCTPTHTSHGSRACCGMHLWQASLWVVMSCCQLHTPGSSRVLCAYIGCSVHCLRGW